jgi:hypothetical protein
MSTLEVCYEVKDHAELLVGSESFVPLSGWPYRKILDALHDDPVETAKELVKKYYAHFSDYEDACVSTDISAIQLEGIGTLVEELKRLTHALGGELWILSGFRSCAEPEALAQTPCLKEPYDELVELGIHPSPPTGYNPERARLVRNALVLARWYAQSYQWENQVDIWDFCDQLLRFLPKNEFGEIHTLCDNVKKLVDAAVVINGWSGTQFQHSHGLSVYFPWTAAEFSPEYYYESDDKKDEKGVSFAKDSGWGYFVKEFLKITRRVRRNQQDHMGEEPRRQGLLKDPLLVKQFSNYHVRSSGPVNTRSSGPINTRSSGPINTRSSGPINTKGGCSIAKNRPDGFYPDDPAT